ncbi:MgtC/SapB family protein [Metabacillus herbersteinensis]|uniref:MgtC/SapB family protein n=1 Tax=Metabacillus herbersteinensis TaxID=283816 RepID=A0ABV6GK71_9BACI
MFTELIDNDSLIMMIRIIFAAILSGFIGLEREFKRHPAGFRTHLLVGVGACLMMVLSLYGFEDYIHEYPNVQFDPARIPSYVISGIGFLGAGTILVKGATVRGLTTAASIWIVAGLGLVIGAGMYLLAVFTTILVLLSLIFLNRLEQFLYRKTRRKRLKITTYSGQNEIGKILTSIAEYDLTVYKLHLISSKKDKKGIISFNYFVELEPENLDDKVLSDLITSIKEVEKVL